MLELLPAVHISKLLVTGPTELTVMYIARLYSTVKTDTIQL